MTEPATIDEPARRLPVVGAYDVVVVGGGIAGVAAALAAAREGATVCLLERYAALGGLATLGNVTIWLPLCDGRGRQVIAGLGEELLRLSVADLRQDHPPARFRSFPACWEPGGDAGQRTGRRFSAAFNPASYLLALEAAVVDAGVSVHYDTRCCGVRRAGRRLTHVVIENKDGRGAVAGRVMVDATGDADVCHAAGEPTESLETNVAAAWFYTWAGGELTLHQLSARYSPRAGKADAEGPFFRGDRAADVTAHLLASRARVRHRLADLRARHPDDDLQPVMPATTACFRMTRRLVAAATVRADDVHRWTGQVVGLTGDWRQAGPVYAIPYASLCATGTVNLLAAGRCMSVDRTAWDVLRAIPPCVVTGQAAGTAAALACREADGHVAALAYPVLRRRLEERGVLLDRALVAEERAATPAD